MFLHKFLVSLGCGSINSENCTYFEVSGANDGDCSAKICKCSNDICQVHWLMITWSYLIAKILSPYVWLNINRCVWTLIIL